MARKVYPDFKGAVLLIMQENLAAIRQIRNRAANLVTKSSIQNKSPTPQDLKRNKKE